MEIRKPVMVRNPHGKVYWVERVRLPELLRQGFEVVNLPGGEDGALKKRQRKRKVKDGPTNNG